MPNEHKRDGIYAIVTLDILYHNKDPKHLVKVWFVGSSVMREEILYCYELLASALLKRARIKSLAKKDTIQISYQTVYRKSNFTERFGQISLILPVVALAEKQIWSVVSVKSILSSFVQENYAQTVQHSILTY